LAGGKHNSFDVNGIHIEAVEAKNLIHSPRKCVGYIISLDGISLYASGDTSITKQMESFAERNLDYALFPCDGVINMSLKMGTKCAGIVGAKHNIPIHLKPRALFNRKRADKWDAPNKLIIEPGQEIILGSERE
jgi:L-ascorbate metabolism protein UlaG (beta-lactamase superfamily)